MLLTRVPVIFQSQFILDNSILMLQGHAMRPTGVGR